MEIDWMTTAAQIANFLVLVFLLQRFLYRPVIAAMDRRERRITDRLEEAHRREDEAQAQAREYRRQQQELEQRRDRLLDEARESADAERQRLIDDARAQVARMRERWERDLEREQRDFVAQLRKQAGRSVMRLAQRAMRDLADRELEQQLIAVFLRRLERIDDAALAELREAKDTLQVSTSFELDAGRRAALTDAVRKRLGESAIRFERAPELICGIELRRGGTKTGWTVAEYLGSLEARFEELLSDASRPGADAAQAAG